jgi:two-component system sensor histidine kinase UhpB
MEHPSEAAIGEVVQWALAPMFRCSLAREPGRMRHRSAERRGPRRPSAFCWTVTDSLRTGSQVASAPPGARPSLGSEPGLAPADASPPQRSRSEPVRSLSLLWWVFLANGSVLVVAFFLLALSPITISAPIKLGELALLLGGLAAMLALNLVLLRRVLSPLFRLTEVMSSVDPDRPGRRFAGVNPLSREGAALIDAFNRMLDRLESARSEAARTALAAQEGERLRIARELHDEIGQTLTAAMLVAERAAEGDPALARRELGRVADVVRESLDEVRRISRELRPEALDDLGLASALLALCSRVDAQGGPRVKPMLQGKLPRLSQEVELVIYRVAQESLTNVLRHADARTASVSLQVDAGRVALTVEDDGPGMPSDLPPGTAGIAGMRERALLVGGRLSIESRPGDGTTVRLEVPRASDGS